MARLLPGVYSAINDLSQFPEGAQSLNVGYVVQANRGPVNGWSLCTSPTDFLTKYTFSGKIDLNADPTMHEIIKVMAQTNTMYVTRAASNPLYGGAFVKAPQKHGAVLAVDQATETFLIKVNKDKDAKEEAPKAGDAITVSGTGLFDGYFIVNEVASEGTIGEFDLFAVTVTGDIKFEASIVEISEASSTDNSFTVLGDYTEVVKKGDIITVSGAKQESSGAVEIDNDGYYKVAHVVLLEEGTVEEPIFKTKIKIDINAAGEIFKKSVDDYNEGQIFFNSFAENSVFRTPIVGLSTMKVASISSIDASEIEDEGEGTGVYNKLFKLDGNVASKFSTGDKIVAKGTEENDGIYTVVDAEFDIESNKTFLTVVEKLKASAGEAGAIYFESIVNPEAILNSMDEDTLFFITGTDPGAYNGEEAFSIVSAFDNKDQLVYYKGAEGLFPEPCTFDTMQLNVYNANTNEQLETFTFSRDPEAKAIDGSSLFVDDIVAGSAYIKIYNNTVSTDVPSSTLAGSPLQASGGSDGENVTAADMIRALSAFEDKTIPISLLGNGCSTQAESATFQQALIQLAVTRKDCFVFLNSRKQDEKYTLPSARAQAIVDYKKGTLANTSFYGCMYAPHVKTPDVFNSRDVEVGPDSVAIAGWLNVINTLNYPYAYAGPRNGLVSGVTCDWKIGDMSGEAEMLNDASVNFVAYDGKVGRYYMQCQNTLQVANSAMRNIGVVLNVLNIKETLVDYLKEFINLPITDSLRRDIMDTVGDYLSPMTGVRFYDYAFQDITTDADIAQDTLRYLLTISPTRYAQRIYLAVNIVRTGFDFSILQSV